MNDKTKTKLGLALLVLGMLTIVSATAISWGIEGALYSSGVVCIIYGAIFIAEDRFL